MGNARRNVRPIKKVKKAVAVVDNQIKTLESPQVLDDFLTNMKKNRKNKN